MCISDVLICAVWIRANGIFHLAISCFGVSTYLLEAYCTDYNFFRKGLAHFIPFSLSRWLLLRGVFFKLVQVLNLTYVRQVTPISSTWRTVYNKRHIWFLQNVFSMCNTPTVASSLFLVLDVYLCKRVKFFEIM
jgi:hypothetical protein